MKHVVYDSGALIAAAKNNQRFLWRHREALASGVSVLVPAGVLAQCWDERASAARLHRVLNGCEILPLTEVAAKAAGALCRRNGTSDVVDASVVLASIAYDEAPIVTDDLGDIRDLVECANRKRIRVERP
ncbi:twitching motility protein PilT [Streptomyces sp. NBC_00286]|uniref:twitching motility protein PilT n=1 Tax=Streptomyces sp. NBC_00286 TaxID=2975701 RepID=UPI002E2A018B|nr:twitching motility protein PilT [Streptomyces sp. NBC_00286]